MVDGLLRRAEVDRLAAEQAVKLGQRRLGAQERVGQLLRADLDHARTVGQAAGAPQRDQVQNRFIGKAHGTVL